jgi:hypothetical protein
MTCGYQSPEWLAEAVCGEMLLRLLRATGIIRGSEISTGIG